MNNKKYYICDGPVKLMYSIALNLFINDIEVSILAVGRKNYFYYKLLNIFNSVNINIVYLATNGFNKNISDLKEKMILNNSFKYYNKIKVNKGIKKNIDNDIIKINKSLLYELNNLFKDTDFNLIMWNNVSFLNNILNIKYKNDNNKNIYIFENGLVRPNTVIIDQHGLNVESSIKNKYADYINNNNVVKHKKSRLKTREAQIPLKYFLMHCIFFLEINTYNRLHFSWKDTFLLLKGKRNIHSRLYKNENTDFIFAPLQLDDDSQSIFFSCSYDVVSFIEKSIFVLNTMNKKFVSNLKIVFKVHPLDRYRKDYKEIFNKYSSDNVIFTFDYDTDTLIEKSKMIFVVNSTVGFTALQKNKNLIVFGNALYLLENISISIEDFIKILNKSQNLESLNNSLNSILMNKVKFVDFITNHYLCKANIDRLNNTDLENILNEII